MCVWVFSVLSTWNIFNAFLKVVTWLTLLVLDIVLFLCLLFLSTIVSNFEVFNLLVSHWAALPLYPLSFSQFLFLANSIFLGVTAEFLLRSKFLSGFLLGALVEVPLCMPHDRQPQRFWIVGWFWLWWIINLSSFLVNLLEFFLLCPPDWHPQRYCWWGGTFLNISAWDINAFLCLFPSLTRSLAVS